MIFLPHRHVSILQGTCTVLAEVLRKLSTCVTEQMKAIRFIGGFGEMSWVRPRSQYVGWNAMAPSCDSAALWQVEPADYSAAECDPVAVRCRNTDSGFCSLCRSHF